MAKVFNPPSSIKPPSIGDFLTTNPHDFDRDGYNAAEQAFLDEVRAFVQERAKASSKKQDHDLIGQTVEFPVADGYASYMVARTTPLEFVHLPLGDAWQFPPVARYRLNEIRALVEANRALNKILGPKS